MSFTSRKLILSSNSSSMWVQGMLPNNRGWISVAGALPSSVYNGYKFVAIIDQSVGAACSEDGANWTESFIPIGPYWVQVIYANGMFVAISGSALAYSSNGRNWSSIQLPAPSDGSSWNNIAYGGGVFVITANRKIAYSYNLTDWTEATVSASFPFNTIFTSVVSSNQRTTYGGGEFVAIVENTNLAYYSNGGVNWIETTLPQNARWIRVAHGGGKFVAIANNSNLVAYSDDGINWSETTLPNIRYGASITYGPDRFIIVSFFSNTASYSFDGINWSEMKLPIGSNWSGVSYSFGYQADRFAAISFRSNISAYLLAPYTP